MPNGLGAILAALAGGAKGYTNLKQREREEALEAERRAREEQDRQEQKAFQQFEMERELRKMGGRYSDETGPGSSRPDAPSTVTTERLEAALPGTETTVGGRVLPPLKVGVTPMKAALGIEPDKERVRMASQAIEVPGSGGKRVYLPTADELGDQAFARTQRQGKIDREVVAGEVAKVTADERAYQDRKTQAANAFTKGENERDRASQMNRDVASQNIDIRRSVEFVQDALMKGQPIPGTNLYTGGLPPDEARAQALSTVAERVGPDAVFRATGAKVPPKKRFF